MWTRDDCRWAIPSSNTSISAWIAGRARRPAHRASNTASWWKRRAPRSNRIINGHFFPASLADFVFRRLLPYPRRIALLARTLYFYQRTGVQSLVRATGVLRLFGLADKEKLLPPIDQRFFFSKLGRTYPAIGPKRARVALFAGCVAQVSFSALHEATIRVLTANGCEVVVPAGQVCCGALAAHAGVRDVARGLARENLDIFLGSDFDAVITNAAGCGSTLKEYEHLFAEGTPEHIKAHAFRKKMRDVTEFLADLGFRPDSPECRCA